MVPVVSWLGQHTWERPRHFVWVLPWAAGQQLGLNVEQEEIWLKEGMFYDLILNEGEQQVDTPICSPRSHHDEYSDHDPVLGLESHENGTLIVIAFSI